MAMPVTNPVMTDKDTKRTSRPSRSRPSATAMSPVRITIRNRAWRYADS